MKKILTMGMCALGVLSVSAARPDFNKSEDILIAQFDSRPDPDDIHSQAALGCMLAHSSHAGVNYYAVAGAYGTQGGDYIESSSLFNMAFGDKNVKWTDAHNDWSGSVLNIRNKVKPILEAGGKVWVQEAGQSNITADWIDALIDDGVDEDVIKNNVIVVQHSEWNEDNTAAADLDYVKDKASYYAIDNGNAGMNATWGDRGEYDTPGYTSESTSFLSSAKSSQNSVAKNLWAEADRICDEQGYHPDWSVITPGGVDFSDCAENWWILGVEDATSVQGFWDKYVTNEVDDTPVDDNPVDDNPVDDNPVDDNPVDVTSETLTPENDAYLQNSTRFNSDVLRVESGRRVSYLQFELNEDAEIESMELQLTVDGDSGNGTIEISEGSHSDWTETNLSTSNAPDEAAFLADSNGTFAIGDQLKFDVSKAVVDGSKVTFIVTMLSGGNDVSFASDEAGSNGPKLVVQYK